MKIISRSEVIRTVAYRLNYDYVGMSRGHGFSFDCDENGNIDKADIHPAGLANYEKCLNGEHKVCPPYVSKYDQSYRKPAVGECNGCKTHISLRNFTNTCPKCSLDYNSAGQQLASRSQWGEETGEHWTECY